MEIISLIIVVIALLIYFSQNRNSNDLSKTLKKYFKNIDKNRVTSLNDIKSQLEIKDTKYQLTINHILNDAKHKIDIFKTHRLEHQQAYNQLSFYKVLANCVIDHALKKNYSIEDTIKILIIAITSTSFIDILEEDISESDTLENLTLIIDGFIKRYKKKKKELE